MTTYHSSVLLSSLVVLAMVNITSAAESVNSDTERRARAFVAEYESRVRPLEIAVGLAWWRANTTGNDEDFAIKEEAQNRLDAALADANKFAELKAILAGEEIDPILARQIETLHLTYLGKQVTPKLLQQITSKENEIEKQFNVFRATVGDRKLTDSEVRKVLSDSKDVDKRKTVWKASKHVGPLVAADLHALVLLRNELARQLGFANYHVLQLHINEQSQQEVLALFDELDELTREPFEEVKKEIDVKLAADYQVSIDELRPWHYRDPFFQEAPSVFGASLDTAFEPLGKDEIVRLCAKFYAGIDLPVDDVITRSDLYERHGKSPHAFCTDIDRQGDIRVLANIVSNEYWMSTMLHELGLAVYSSKNIPMSLPYVLRTESHILTTEGVAMMFERFAKNGDWLVAMGVKIPDVQAYNKAGARVRRDHLLIFSRWCQVMLRFEMGLYDNPDQDLNKLWWSLVEKYQGLKWPDGRDAPDYASKIHIVSAPCYYHNYMLGQLFACQVHRTVAREVLHKNDWTDVYYTNDPRVGQFMRERVFASGRSLKWNELTQHATGEPLNAQAFAEEFGGVGSDSSWRSR